MTKGIAAGQGIIKALTSEQMTSAFKNIAKIAGALGPFLGAAGPVVSLISMFLPHQESAELKYMKEQFSKMDQKFDQVFNQFGEVKNLIQQTSLKTQYGAYEHQIKSLSGKLSEYLQAPVDEAPVFRRTFISDYKSTY
ncbi:hypothetical protein FSP39_014970 [Pinctada imbricata]|uniref:Uncharacterized protein n=1 Tax=Pinctada imbricata TaxID=66713 RepID=A0AA88YD95_PINIB|nr:hypothetical protein FSP39_014970 [Pinctada imbricata]